MTDRKENRKHLFYLHELSDFKVDSDDPDVRGWEVKDADNRVIGKVDNLLVSKEKKRVVYLDVEVDKSIIDANHDPYGNPASGDVHEFVNKEGENHLILPIGLAKLNVNDKFVYTDRINHQTFAETKRMAKGYDVDRDYELVVLESYNRDDNDSNRDRKDNDFEVDTQTGNYRSGDTGGRSTGAGIDDERRRMKDNDKDHSGMTESLGTDRNLSSQDRDLTDRDRTGTTGTSGSLSDRDKDLKDRNLSGTTSPAGSRDKDFGDRDSSLTDRDKNLTDRDKNLTDRDRELTDRDRRRNSDDDSFYDRGEFDQDKYRSNR